MVEYLVELFKRASACLDTKEEPKHGSTDIPTHENKVVPVSEALQANRRAEGVDETRTVGDENVHYHRRWRKKETMREHPAHKFWNDRLHMKMKKITHRPCPWSESVGS